MSTNSVALILTSAEAHALFEAAALGLSVRAGSGTAGNDKAVDALQKIERQMGSMPKSGEPSVDRERRQHKRIRQFAPG
jgi:hypothetical protein